jgi:4-hydroxybenzoate polyprenyltransferase
MNASPFITVLKQLKSMLRIGAFELYLSYRFTWRDLSATVIPNLIMVIAALRYRGDWSAATVLSALGRTLLYFWLYIYAFCLANQLAGVDEDRSNKPDRPIAAGLVSTEGAQRRWTLIMVLFPIVGWWFGILKWTVLWQVCIILHNFYGFSKHWFPKNMIIMPVGLVALMAPAWELVTPLSPIAWRWIVVLAVMLALTIHLQDLRDIKGDGLIGRKTLPLDWGERNARIALFITFLLRAVVVHFLLMAPLGFTLAVIVCDLLLVAMDIITAIRIITSSSPRKDHKTYMLYTYHHCLAMAVMIVVL